VDIQILISKEDPDMIWTPGDYRESYSYNLDHHLTSGFPLLLPNMPIYKERAQHHQNYQRVVFYDDTTQLQNILDKLQGDPLSGNDKRMLLYNPFPKNLQLMKIKNQCALEYVSLIRKHFDITQPHSIRQVLVKPSWFGNVVQEVPKDSIN
jgi:hypothetical protein